MKRQIVFLFIGAALLTCLIAPSAGAVGVGLNPSRGMSKGMGFVTGRGLGKGFGHGAGFGHHRGFGHGDFGFGFGGFGGCCGWDIAELYRQLYNNLPFYALHPPVYYSDIVPRTYGYSPFAYPPGVMTPEIACAPQPVSIINPYVPQSPAKPADTKSDPTTAASPQPEPLVIINPFVTPRGNVAASER
jgi:hypothetical protein